MAGAGRRQQGEGRSWRGCVSSHNLGPPRPSVRLEKGCGARKQTTSTPSDKLGKAVFSPSHCTISKPKYLHSPLHPTQPLYNMNLTVREVVPPSEPRLLRCAAPGTRRCPAQAAHSTAHCPLNSTLPSSFSRSKLRRPFLSHRPTLLGLPEASIVVHQI